MITNVPQGDTIFNGGDTDNDTSVKTQYPDISRILEAKAARRRVVAAMSWEEKVAILERMRRGRGRDLWGKNRPLSVAGDSMKMAENFEVIKKERGVDAEQ